MHSRIVATTRRRLFQMLAAGGGLGVLGLPADAIAQSRKDVLVLGMDISDLITYDPATATGQYTHTVIKMNYDMLVTMDAGDYVDLKPQLATAWARTPNGWRLTLRQGVKFSSGNPLTAEDVKWSIDRVINKKGQPSLYLLNLKGAEVVDDQHVDLVLEDPRRPILEILCHPSFTIYERKVLEQHGGDASMDAKTKDTASDWLNQNSCGTGPYVLTGWKRGISVQLEANPHSWRGASPFQRVIIRHLADSSAQLLAIQRGDIDMAFNLIPEQVALLETSKNVRVQTLEGFDMMYVALTADPEFNKALAMREARQAVAWAIDYDGIRKDLLSGAAQRPASVLPIGLLGSTAEIAREIGPRQDLAKAKALLAKAGFPEGFTFKMSYGNANVSTTSYGVVAQKMQSDLARVGIKMELDPQEPVTNRTQFNAGRLSAVMQFWHPSGIDNWIWASVAVPLLAKRMHFTPAPDLAKLVDDGNIEPDQEKRKAIWIQFQKRMIEEAYLFPLFQVNYQIAVSNRLKPFPLNASAWYFDADDVKPV